MTPEAVEGSKAKALNQFTNLLRSEGHGCSRVALRASTIPKEFTEEFIMGTFSILNNIPAIYAQNHLGVTQTSLNQTINRLSSGKRINSGADDAAGLMIADTLKANIHALNQAVRNANDCISVGQIADGALQEITNLLTRSITLAEEAATETVDDNGRSALNQEFTQIKEEISRIAAKTNFDGVKLFTADGMNGDLQVFVGDIFDTSSITVTIDMISADNLGGVNLTDDDMLTQAAAITTLTEVRDALIQVASERGTIGAGMNRLQSAVQVMLSQSLNTQSAESTIRDANMATEISNLTKYQILSQSGIAALTQANNQGGMIISLLQG